MSIGEVISLMRGAVTQIITIIAPILGLALIVGLISGAYSSIFISSGFISACRKNWKPEFGVHHSLKAAKKDE